MKPLLPRSLPREPPGGFLRTGWLWHKIYKNGTEKAAPGTSGFWNASSNSRISSTSLQRKSGVWTPSSGAPSGRPGRAWANATGNSANSGTCSQKSIRSRRRNPSRKPRRKNQKRNRKHWKSRKKPMTNLQRKQKKLLPRKRTPKAPGKSAAGPGILPGMPVPSRNSGMPLPMPVCASIRISPSPRTKFSITGGTWKSSTAGKQRQQPPQEPGSRRFSSATKTGWNSPPGLCEQSTTTSICPPKGSPAPIRPGNWKVTHTYRNPYRINSRNRCDSRSLHRRTTCAGSRNVSPEPKEQRPWQRNKRKKGSGHGMF